MLDALVEISEDENGGKIVEWIFAYSFYFP